MSAQPSSSPGIFDTSVFVAREARRNLGPLPTASGISVMTVAELYLGVLLADDPSIRAQRLRTLSRIEAEYAPVSIDTEVAHKFAEIVAAARRAGRRPKVPDVLIAATACVLDLPVHTQDADFDAIPEVQVVHV